MQVVLAQVEATKAAQKTVDTLTCRKPMEALCWRLTAPGRFSKWPRPPRQGASVRPSFAHCALAKDVQAAAARDIRAAATELSELRTQVEAFQALGHGHATSGFGLHVGEASQKQEAEAQSKKLVEFKESRWSQNRFVFSSCYSTCLSGCMRELAQLH